MTWTLVLAALTLSALPVGVPPTDDPPAKAVAQAPTGPTPVWELSMRVVAPATTTDPQHVAVRIGAGRTGAYRGAFQYQPSETGLLGLIHASMGVRLVSRASFQLTAGLEYNQVWADRRLFRGTGWQLEGHDQRRLSLGTLLLVRNERRTFGVIESLEVGAGRMYIRRLVSARAGSQALNQEPSPIRITSGPVGMIGVRLARSLFWGLSGRAHVRVIGAGRSRGGEVPFVHLATEWDVTRQIFSSPRFGRGALGVSGNHATSSRATSYFQNGIGLTFRIVF